MWIHRSRQGHTHTVGRGPCRPGKGAGKVPAAPWLQRSSSRAVGAYAPAARAWSLTAPDKDLCSCHRNQDGLLSSPRAPYSSAVILHPRPRQHTACSVTIDSFGFSGILYKNGTIQSILIMSGLFHSAQF